MLLALDLGNSTGWALFDGRELIDSGTFKVKKGLNRWDQWADNVTTLVRKHQVKTLAWERVRSHTVHGAGGRKTFAVDAAHNHGAFLALCESVAYREELESVPVEVSTWKKSIGAKSQSKQAYVDAVNARYGLKLTLKEEDQAAAIGVGHHATRGSKC